MNDMNVNRFMLIGIKIEYKSEIFKDFRHSCQFYANIRSFIQTTK